MKDIKLNISDEIEMRFLNHTHSTELFNLIQDNRKFLYEWFGWVRKIKSEKDCLENIKRNTNNFFSGISMEFGIFKNNVLIGKIGFISIVGHTAEIGYWLSESENGKGIITRCCKLLIQYTFFHTDIFRIEIKVDAENIKSKRIPERLGFTLEGVQRGGKLFRGEYRDLLIYSILKTDSKNALY